MKTFFVTLCLILYSNILLYSQDKKLNINGITYLIDTEKGTASVSSNYQKQYKWKYIGAANGNIALSRYVPYKRKDYLVTTIEDLPTLDSYNINSIIIPNSIVDIKSLALKNMPSLKIIDVDTSNQHYLSRNGVLFNKGMTEIIRFPPNHNDTSYVIPSTVITIGENAFNACLKLKSITIPNSVKYIRSNSFCYCNFNTITIPNSIIEISTESFRGCAKLSEIQIPESVKIVGYNAFSDCKSLTKVSYQNDDLQLSKGSFENCQSLSSNNIIYEAPKEMYLEQASKGNPEYQYKLALCYMKGVGFNKDPKSAREWLIKASQKNHALSQKTLGDIYFKGIGVQKNTTEATKWYNLAAKNGNTSAQIIIGYFYQEGIGTKQNINTAINYYITAAKQGDEKAEEKLGNIYFFGCKGIGKNYKEAAKWYQLSANKGNSESAYYLAICYSEGKGVNRNDAEALMWTNKAIEGGVTKALNMYCKLTYNDAINNMYLKNYSRAISQFSSLLKHRNSDVKIYVNRGYCYFNLKDKDIESAKNDFQKALDIDNSNSVARNNLKYIVEYEEKESESIKLCEEAKQYYLQSDYTNAVSCCAKSISIDDSNPYPYALIGDCYSQCELYSDAINYYNKALSVNPNYSKAKDAIKKTKTIVTIKSIGQVLTDISTSLNNAYKNSINTNNRPSNVSSIEPETGVEQETEFTQTAAPTNTTADDINKYLKEEANKATDSEKKNSQYYYNYYLNLAKKEQNEAEYYQKQADYATDEKDKTSALENLHTHSNYANEYLEKANIYR